MARHASEGTGIGRLLALARRLGNQAIQRVLGESRDDDASVATGSGGDAGAVERLARTLGTDPSGVRVVDDPTSHAAADALGASALTVGDTVLLGRDAPPPSTPAREHLLAHELAHVAQQRASGTVCDTVGAPDDAHELSARAAAASAVRGDRSTLSVAGAGPPPAVQLQRKKRNEGLDRAAAQQRLEAYFTRVLAEQGGRSVRMTDDVKGTLRRIFLNDMQGLLTFDTFLTGTAFPGSPAELAAAVAKYLPDPIDASRLAHLDLPSAGSTKLGRVKDLAKSTEPYVSPETQQQQWEFDRQAKEARRNDQTVIGPFGVDLNRILNIGKGLPKALEGPKRQKQTGEPNATLDATIASIDPHSLTPAAARGGPKAGDYADAQLVARAIADELNRAQAAKDKRITLRLDALYAGVEDRDSIIAEVARIARLVRDALPHKASEVRALDLYFGNKIVRQISLAGAAEKTEGSQ